jgi:hypothetical protein
MTSPTRRRHLYRLSLPTSQTVLDTDHPTAGSLRNPSPEETEALAELMLDAYRGSVDAHGETTDDALSEVEGYFLGKMGEPLIDSSWVYDNNGTLLAACLITERDGGPLLAYLMTRSPWQRRGLASYVLRQSILSLQDARHESLSCIISEGNSDAEAILEQFGFVRS